MKAIYIIAEEGFRDEEYFEPKEILEQNSIEVITGSTKKVAKSKLGLEVETCTLLEDIKSEEYELIILAGGPGTHNYFENLTLRKLLKEFDEQNKLIAAICIAPIILAKAGILRGKKATVWSNPATLEVLKKEEAEYVDEKVVVDEDRTMRTNPNHHKFIITANGPEASKAFGEKIIEKLKR